MKNIYLILAICLISTLAIGQKNHQNKFENSTTLDEELIEILELNENAVHNKIILNKKKSYSKTNDNRHAVSEYITTAKNWRTGAIENSSKVVFNYNSQGELYLKTYYSWDSNKWNYSLKFEYAYVSGNISVLIDYWYENNYWNKNTKTTYSYNTEGDVKSAVKQYQHNSTWTNYSKIDYTYNQFDNLDYYISYNWTSVVSSWSEINKTEYSYYDSKKGTNSDDKISFITVYNSSNGWVNYSRTGLTYDDSDNLIEETYAYWTATTTDWEASSKLDYLYDSSNRLTEYITSYSDGTNLAEYSKNTFSYDGDSNVDLQMGYKWKSSEWQNNNRVTNLVYDNTISSEELIIHNIFDEKINMKHMLKSMDNEEWTNSAWKASGGISIDYVEVNILNLNDSDLFLTKIFPNPANGFISIVFDKTMVRPTLEIYESNGKRIFVKEIENGETINTSHYKCGMYYYTLSDGYKTYNGKLLIK